MPYRIRRSQDRKTFQHGWLTTSHTFSFASYYDPQFMGFRNLRVINEDRVQPGKGFPLHEHENMEILSLVLEGELAHKDSMGNEEKILANEIQVMSAGSGIAHSEYNPSSTQPVHFLQIWILPDTNDVAPRYEKTTLTPSSNEWKWIASKTGKEGSLKIQQDVEVLAIALEKGKKTEKVIPPNRFGWLQLIQGELKMNEEVLKSGDGVAIDPHTHLQLEAILPSKILFFDLN